MSKRRKLFYVFIFWASVTGGPTLDSLRFPMEKESTTPGRKMMMRQTGTDLDAFLRDVAFIESGENHEIVSRYNMLGKYQFSWPTAKQHLKKWNLDTISKKDFLNRPDLQDSVMFANLDHNQKILDPYIKKYANQTIHGIQITRSGILAAAQFGPGKVIEFFEGVSKHGLYDGNGVHVGTYMQLFSNYRLPRRFAV